MLKIMNKIFNKLALIALAVFTLTACVGDLNVEPKDPNVVMTFEQDAVFTKIYATFGTTGQQGAAGNGDVDGIDEGISSFYRMTWSLQEFPADICWWNYNEFGYFDIIKTKWNGLNESVRGLYYRLYFDITLCNHFLDRTAGLDDEKTLQQRAEVRLIRAINYYYLLDMYGNVPFAETVSLENPKLILRADLYDWLENELMELVGLLPETKISYYRMDKVAAEFMLMRLYLNAEVYTGTAQWDKAAEYAAKVMNSQYELNTEVNPNEKDLHGKPFTAYQRLFMANNDQNGAQKEAIFAVAQDGQLTQCWGGSVFLVAAPRDAGYNNWGISASWTCLRATPELVWKFFPNVPLNYTVDATYAGDEYELPTLAGDDRAILCNQVKDSTGAVTKEWEFTGKQTGDPYANWAVLKWTALHSDGKVSSSPDFPDTDIILFRAAEAWLSYAEAVFRGGKAVNGSAEDAVKALRARANNTQAFTLSESFLLDEWAREFYYEGRRRTDLVRFGKFTGPTADYQWEGRGDKNSGDEPKVIDAKYNVYPVPESDIVANPNLAEYRSLITY